ncbi:MAG: TadE/TadG family type IV pilus assembly protein [Pseudomonadales bacterium]
MLRRRYANSSRQRGYVSSVEMGFGLLPLMALIFFFADITRIYNAREQLQEAAFALASVAANRSVSAEGKPLADSAGRNAEYQGLLALAKALLPSRADTVTVQLQEFAPNSQSAAISLGGSCVASSLDAVQQLPIYSVRVTVCDSKDFYWWSAGLTSDLLNESGRVLTGSALLPER